MIDDNTCSLSMLSLIIADYQKIENYLSLWETRYVSELINFGTITNMCYMRCVLFVSSSVVGSTESSLKLNSSIIRHVFAIHILYYY